MISIKDTKFEVSVIKYYKYFSLLIRTMFSFILNCLSVFFVYLETCHFNSVNLSGHLVFAFGNLYSLDLDDP